MTAAKFFYRQEELSALAMKLIPYPKGTSAVNLKTTRKTQRSAVSGGSKAKALTEMATGRSRRSALTLTPTLSALFTPDPDHSRRAEEVR